MFACCMQVLGLAVPLLAMVQKEPMSAMFLSSAVIFLNDLCTMTLIFIPKIKAMVQNYALHISNDTVTPPTTKQQPPKGGTRRNIVGGWRGGAAQVNPQSSTVVSTTSNVNSVVVNTES
jgi:hypothetical protein